MGTRFDLTWFIPAVVKYRKLFGEVLLASFFLQLFGLISPLFFQVVTDKVLVHRAQTSLDVLIFALIAVSLFEVVLGYLRTYVFSHTTNRIDVELGSRLFRHLMSLPIAYHGARRVGDTVARVRELENIRSFLTGSALTLVIDLGFTVVFFAVMFWYAPVLAWIVVGSLPFYVVLSLLASPVLKSLTEEKFKRGAENQALLVEACSGVETVKALAVEPQMQRKWDEQLAAYVQTSFKASNFGSAASQGVQTIQKVTSALTLWFGAQLVMDGDLTIGQLVAFNMLAGRVSQPILRLAQLAQDFSQVRISVDRLGDRREPGLLGIGVNHFFTLNSEKVVLLRQEEQYTFHVPAGQHIVGALCEGPFDVTHELSLNAQPGGTYFLRMYTDCLLAPMSR